MEFKECEQYSVLLLFEIILTWWMNVRSENCVLRINSAELRLVRAEFHLERLNASADTKKLIREAATHFTCLQSTEVKSAALNTTGALKGHEGEKIICCSDQWEDWFSFLLLWIIFVVLTSASAALPASCFLLGEFYLISVRAAGQNRFHPTQQMINHCSYLWEVKMHFNSTGSLFINHFL